MSFKSEIVKNNTELENVKVEIGKLPMADDVKNGKYVWGKSKREIDSVEVRGSYTESKAYRDMLLSLGIALFDNNKKYIGKPNEEIFPASATNVYILAPATDNNGHVIEGETVYHIVGYSLGTPGIPDVKKYNDFTINYAKAFISYVVSNTETAYPDGGEKDGYWYERVTEGVPLPPTYTKYDIVKVIPSRDTYSNDGFTIHHNLGCFPKFFFLQAGQRFTELNHIQAIIGGAGASQDNANFIYQQGGSYTFGGQMKYTHNPTETQLQFNWYGGGIFKAGVEYTLITMA